MTKVKRRGTPHSAFTLDSLTITEVLAFIGPWSPPVTEDDRRRFPRWSDWSAYFRDYDLIRDELLASEYRRPGMVLFADEVRRVLAAARPGEVYQAHFHRALRHSHLYQRGDGHVHTDPMLEARLGPATEARA